MGDSVQGPKCVCVACISVCHAWEQSWDIQRYGDGKNCGGQHTNFGQAVALKTAHAKISMHASQWHVTAKRAWKFSRTCHCQVRISRGPVMTAHINGGDDCACWTALLSLLSFCCSLRIMAKAPVSRLSVGEALDSWAGVTNIFSNSMVFSLLLYSTLLCFALRLVMEGILSH